MNKYELSKAIIDDIRDSEIDHEKRYENICRAMMSRGIECENCPYFKTICIGGGSDNLKKHLNKLIAILKLTLNL